jgi:tetratricopeptide (TPR) repeat protein
LVPLAGQPICATCHPKIAATYALTGMAQSFHKVEGDTGSSNPYYHERSATWYSMERRDGQLLQSRWRAGPDGGRIHLRELSVDFVMGSGNHARSFLHRTARGALLELPFAWYPENGGTWAMSPGHDRDYTLPPRAIQYECMFCHNGYPQIPARHEEPGAEPLYSNPLPAGIDCQRCHGPGGDHVAKAQAGKPVADVRSAIVNPARLGSDRQMEVCLQCHLETTALPLPHSLVKYGRSPFSYRPGEPLGDFAIYFDHARGSDDFEIAHSAYRLRKSRCFLRSAPGRLTCTTCHNPHDVPRGPQAVAHYNGVCGQCHAGRLGPKHTAAADCVACHMTKRRTQDVIHAVMTDHLIARRPSIADPLARVAERKEEFDANLYRGEVIPYYPSPLAPTPENLLTLAVAQVTQKSNLARGLPQLAAEIARRNPAQAEYYVELGQAWLNAGKPVDAVAAFENALKRKPESITALLSLADTWTQTGQPTKATALLNRAIQNSPDEALLWYQLGLAYAAAHREPDATNALEKALTLDPNLAEAHSILGGILAGSGDMDRAEQEFLLALEVNPDLPEGLSNLAQVRALRGDLNAAAYYLGRSLKLRPSHVGSRINYAVTLAGLQRYEEAQQQIDLAVKADPKSPEAHNFRGTLLERAGLNHEALAEFETAAGLRPDYGIAHLNAGRILAASGDKTRATQHFRQAAASADPNIRKRAAAALDQLARPQ